MNISSSAFENNDNIPPKYTCDGYNISPPIEISDVPEGTLSLALVVYDPDAPAGIWVHWLVWNINPEAEVISEGSLPVGAIEGVTSSGEQGYAGPCPPSGTHRYFFKLYALDTVLDIPDRSEREALLAAMEGHVLDETELVGLYGRE